MAFFFPDVGGPVYVETLGKAFLTQEFSSLTVLSLLKMSFVLNMHVVYTRSIFMATPNCKIRLSIVAKKPSA